MSRGGDWPDQDRPLGPLAHVGEMLAGAVLALGVQTWLTAGLVALGAVWNGVLDNAVAARWIAAASCAQCAWVVPAFVLCLWWRPGLAGGLVAGATGGVVLGFAVACLALAS